MGTGLHARFARPLWHLVDARNQIVGRLASQLVHILRGKHKPNFTPSCDCGDYVVVINARHVKMSGKKLTDQHDGKIYRWHTGYVGGLKEVSAKKFLETRPDDILRRAVYGMLPKNKLRKEQMKKLRIFTDEKHLHEDKLPPGTESVFK